MKASPAVTALFQQLIDQIEAEVREEFLGRLGVDGAAPRKKTPFVVAKPPKAKGSLTANLTPPKRKKGAKRTQEELAATKKTILAAIKKTPGSRVEELATTLGLTTADMALPMLQLRDERLITKKGEKRAARYTAK